MARNGADDRFRAAAAAAGIDVSPVRITFAFLGTKKVPRQQCEDARPWLEGLVEQALGRKIPVSVSVVEVTTGEAPEAAAPADAAGGRKARAPEGSEQLGDEAMENPTVQAVFEIFPVEKVRVDEM